MSGIQSYTIYERGSRVDLNGKTFGDMIRDRMSRRIPDLMSKLLEMNPDYECVVSPRFQRNRKNGFTITYTARLEKRGDRVQSYRVEPLLEGPP